MGTLRATVQRATKTWNLFCNIAAKRVKKKCCAFYQPHSNLSCNKSGFCKLREYWLLIGKNYAGVALYTWVASFATKQVCLGPVYRATYTDFVAKSRTTLCFLQQLLAIYLLAWENSDAITGLPREVTSDKRAHKFHTDDVPLPRSG